MKETYTPMHLHDHHSNINMVEVVTKFDEYVEKAMELGLPTVICTNHGVLTGWYQRKKLLESKGMKYVHAVEGYISWTLNEKVRDNFHLSLFAKNFDGFKELNKLVSKSFNRNDNHFYYNPRMSWEEIKGTSDNILISTACLGGLMWRLKNDNEKYNEILNWIELNKHRVFLEVQPHKHDEQINLNKHLLEIANKNGYKIIAGGDVHALNKDHDDARKILQKSKRVVFSDEDSFDLTLKSYDELFRMFQDQGVLSDNEIKQALQNTNLLLSMVEEFELDYSKKYPKLYDDSSKVLKEKIKEGIKFRGIDKFPSDTKSKYIERIKYELETYKVNEAEDYLLLEDMVKSYAREMDVPYGYGRGSVSGSIIAYLMRITEMDSIQRGLNFERFMNKERISLADVDSDYSPSRRSIIQDFLMNHPDLYCSPIMTANTIALKGAIRDIGRGLEIPLSEVDDIAKNIEEKEGYYRNNYPDLFKYVDIVQGVITSIGQHACGVCISPIPLDENMGLITTSDSEYPLTMLNMKEIDDQNYVKLDILGLDTTEIISETCKLAGIDFVNPQNLEQDDEKVWESIIESNIGIFQWESDFSHQIFKDLFSKTTINNIKKKNPNFSYIDLFSLGNAILRPSGASYRDSVCKGEFYDNGHDALNSILSPTLGRLVYQEQLLEFLVKFCGYTGGQADLVRRGIGKKIKKIIDEEVPKIEDKFINTMVSKYKLTLEEAEKIAKPFMQVFIDSANYGFSINHSDAYSWMGYACAWLRYYYPIEFITTCLNVNIGKEEKTSKLIEYAKSKGIDVKPIKFRYSHAGYMFDKKTNSIYQGIKPIKFLNSQVAEELYSLKDNSFPNFTRLLFEIHHNTNCSFKQLEILIQLKFFEEFGKNEKLLNVLEEYKNRLKNKKLKEDTINKRLLEIEGYERDLKDKDLNIKDQIKAEIDYYGYEVTTIDKSPKNVYIVTGIDSKYTPRIRLYCLKNGEVLNIKCKKVDMRNNQFGQFSIIQITNLTEKNKMKKVNNEWVKSEEKEQFLSGWNVLK